MKTNIIVLMGLLLCLPLMSCKPDDETLIVAVCPSGFSMSEGGECVVFTEVSPGATAGLRGTPGKLTGSYGTSDFSVDGEGIYFTNYMGNSAPGPEMWLSNDYRSIDNAVFLTTPPSGEGDWNVSTKDAYDYNYIVIWCRPFNTPIGYGQIPGS